MWHPVEIHAGSNTVEYYQQRLRTIEHRLTVAAIRHVLFVTCDNITSIIAAFIDLSCCLLLLLLHKAGGRTAADVATATAATLDTLMATTADNATDKRAAKVSSMTTILCSEQRFVISNLSVHLQSSKV
jgi:uncharacterized phage protein gp47/JayE